MIMKPPITTRSAVSAVRKLPRGALVRPDFSHPPAVLPIRSRNDLFCCQSVRSFFSLPDISKLAGLTSTSKDESGIEVDGEEQRFHARKILPYSPAQLYSLIADVPSYASFIPFCTSSTVLVPAGGPARNWAPGEDPFEVEAELTVGFGGFEERYISRVVGRPFESVTATASERTPMFKSLVTKWSFTPTSPAGGATGPTLLSIDLAFAFANPLHRIASQAVLPKVADKMVDAFESRCLENWGPGKLWNSRIEAFEA